MVHAQVELASRSLRRLGHPVVVEADVALLAGVHEAAGNVACLRDLVGRLSLPGELTVDDLVGGPDQSVGSLVGPDHLGDLREHPLSAMYREWCDRMVRYAAEAVKCGLAERRVAAEERLAMLLARAMMSLLDDPEVGLSREQRERGRLRAGHHLRALGSIEEA